MTTTEILREQVRKYINTADENSLRRVNAILEIDQNSNEGWRNKEYSSPVNFLKNDYLKSFSDFWKLEALFKKEELKNALNSFSGEISNSFIEAIFKTSTLQFYTDSLKKYLFAYTSPAFSQKYGELEKLDAMTALKWYGIDKLEETGEKGYSKI